MNSATLMDYLHQLQAAGKTHVYLDEGAKSTLRNLFKKAKEKNAPEPVTPVAPPAVKEAPQTVQASETPTAPPAFSISSTAGSSIQRLEILKQQLNTWTTSSRPKTLRSSAVFSSGNPEADIFMIGEAPGFQEEKEGHPFAGPSGAKLDGILKAMGLTRDHIYLTNVVKCRPAMDNQSTGNRPPTEEEITSCLPFLQEELSIVQPKCIITLGRTATKTLVTESGTIRSLRGAWYDFKGTPVRVSFHPSYLLHDDRSITDKRAVWEDMLAIMEKMQMPISEKQKGYFLPRD